jgi:prefoldin subunit 5
MLTKGVGDIRGIRSLNTRPGPITESKGLLKLYQLAAEKDNLMKKLEGVKRQKDQTEKRLSEIAHAMHTVKRIVEERTKREPAVNTHPGSRGAFIQY